MDAAIDIGKFMKANDIAYHMHDTPMFKYCFIEVDGPKIRGTLHFKLPFTRREAIGLLHGLGIAVSDATAG
jgi:hypothetical protein